MLTDHLQGIQDALAARSVFALSEGLQKKHAQLCAQAGWNAEDTALVLDFATDQGKRRLESVFTEMESAGSWGFVLNGARRWRDVREAEAEQQRPGDQGFKPRLRDRMPSSLTWEEKVQLAGEVAREFASDNLEGFALFLNVNVDEAAALLHEANATLSWDGKP